MKALKIGDYLIIFVIILLSAVLLLLPFDNGDTAYIVVDNEIIKKMPLSTDDSFVYNGKYTNTIVVKSGKVYVSDSDCPDKTCVYSGKTDSSDKVICCLPNNLLIRVDKQGKTDVISKWIKKL